jgi:hypothetical protein
MLVDRRYLEMFHQGFHSSSPPEVFLANIFLKPLPPPDTSFLAALGIRYFISDQDADDLGCREIARSRSGRYRILENPAACPAWWLSDQWRVLDADSIPARTQVLDTLEGRPSIQAASDGFAPPPDPPALMRRIVPIVKEAIRKDHSPNHQEYVIELAVPALLVVHEQYHSAWRCYINDQETPILRVNGFQRGVILAPGKSVVHFHFMNPWVLIGTGVSLAMALLWLGLILHLWRRSRYISRAQAVNLS